MPKTLHLVEKSEPLDEIRTLIELTNTTFQNRTLVNLAIVFTSLLLIEVDASSYGLEVSRNAVGIDAMRFGESHGDARVLRQIAVGVLDRQTGMRLAHAVQQSPTHDAHEGFRPERMTALDLQLDLSCVISLVACLAQRDQVVWRITVPTSQNF